VSVWGKGIGISRGCMGILVEVEELERWAGGSIPAGVCLVLGLVLPYGVVFTRTSRSRSRSCRYLCLLRLVDSPERRKRKETN
jgi:hypothetical protein